MAGEGREVSERDHERNWKEDKRKKEENDRGQKKKGWKENMEGKGQGYVGARDNVKEERNARGK